MEKKLITGISINENTAMVNIENIPTYAKNVYIVFNSARKKRCKYRYDKSE